MTVIRKKLSNPELLYFLDASVVVKDKALVAETTTHPTTTPIIDLDIITCEGSSSLLVQR